MMRSALAATLWVVLTGMPADAATIYSNYDYGFPVVVPDGLAVERDEPPRPNHGFSVMPGPSTGNLYSPTEQVS